MAAIAFLVQQCCEGRQKIGLKQVPSMDMNDLPPQVPQSPTAKIAPIEASKWLSSQVLIDADEMQELFNALNPFYIYLTSQITKKDGGRVSQAEFLDCYRTYIADLQHGKLPDEALFRHLFSSAFTVAPDALCVVLIGDDQQMIRNVQPVVQLQSHRMDYSSADGKFRSMTFGTDSIMWGIQFSYPQLFRNPATKQVEEVDDTESFPNTRLFRTLQRWVRHNTTPTPFLVEGQRINVPMRLGKQCYKWINNHPQLLRKGLRIDGGN